MIIGPMADALKLIREECNNIINASTSIEAEHAFGGILALVQLIMMSDFSDYLAMPSKGGKIDSTSRGLNNDASQRLAFGLCKKYGIELPKGATPADAWNALKEKTGKEAGDFYSHSGEKGADKVKFNTASQKSFVKNLNNAKASRPPKDRWRVTGMDLEELKKDHPNAKLHVTDGGSTIAIDKGDIVAVCKRLGDNVRGENLLALAVKNGGKKLDSYDGNHEYYISHGFEPVSWCKWDDNFAPPDWRPGIDHSENIIFYKYTGKTSSYKTPKAFYADIPASQDYDEAYKERDRAL